MKKSIIAILIVASISLIGCDSPVKSASARTRTHKVKANTTQVSNTTNDTSIVSTQTPIQSTNGSNIQYYFTRANGHPDQQLIKIINSATKTLDIAIYSITKDDIVNAIIQDKQKGITVRLMTDRIESKSKSESKELALLSNADIPIKINSHSGLLHMKASIIDDKIVTTGSYNYTNNASTQNDEVLVILNDSSVTQGFESEFNAMWNDTNNYTNY
jgi:phosphatidylserine/phosphatidylglycerophosphate/cardiolipin synthase-like enzyme